MRVKHHHYIDTRLPPTPGALIEILTGGQGTQYFWETRKVTRVQAPYLWVENGDGQTCLVVDLFESGWRWPQNEALSSIAVCQHAQARVQIDSVTTLFFFNAGFDAYGYCPACGLRGKEMHADDALQAAQLARRAWENSVGPLP